MIIGPRQSGLGRGLGALIPPKPQASPIQPAASSDEELRTVAHLSGEGVRPNTNEIHFLPVESIDPNPHQPRSHFDHTQLEDLILSIQTHGVLQPIVVTPKEGGRYELIAGERRLRASKIAGLETIPAIVRTATEQQKLELALIENIQRQDLNVVEEAEAYIRLQNEFNLTQEELAKRAGKSRSQVANTIRLLQLPEQIKEALMQGKISPSNGRTLLSLSTDEERLELFRNMLEGNFTVRQTEARVPHRRNRQPSLLDPNLLSVEQRLRNVLGTKVVVKRDPRGEGEVRITFLNDEDLKSIIKRIAGEED
ncbi:ParB/RepB/Spo0J family partition protein [Candidatus Uhrbacteria bacterium]|nr:ParB/RepB/Spo0J family partition protein [Candidatus Uhrbacteria bacterium]